jgi:hypothetical protein
MTPGLLEDLSLLKKLYYPKTLSLSTKIEKQMDQHFVGWAGTYRGSQSD